MDNKKLADLLCKFEQKLNKKINYFIQVNIGNEKQKSGIAVGSLDAFFTYCTKDLKLNVIGKIPEILLDNSYDILGVIIQKNYKREIKHYK